MVSMVRSENHIIVVVEGVFIISKWAGYALEGFFTVCPKRQQEVKGFGMSGKTEIASTID